MSKELFPIGVRRDGSYYTRVLWADVTENDPTFWVNNLINDDLERNGGTWGANSETTANAVLDFFGETQTISKISIYKNVGITISVLEELAKNINIYVSTTDEPLKLRRKEDKIDAAAGITVFKKTGDYVKRGECIARLYATDTKRFKEAEEMLLSALTFGSIAPVVPPIIHQVIKGGSL